jgi:Flp pilus assembly protein TadG
MNVMRRLAGERGTAVLEFAIVAPVIVLIVFGIIDFARAMNYYDNLTSAAGQGARAAAVSLNPDNGTAASGTSIQTALINTITPSQEQRGNVHVCIVAPSTALGQPVTVQTYYRVPFFFGATGLDIRTSATERISAPVTWTAGNVGGPC